jgi:hypothetical protein
MNRTYQEGNLIESYPYVERKVHFCIPEYLQPIVWRKVHDIFTTDNKSFTNTESFPIRCTECKQQSNEGIWAEQFYICKMCACNIMMHFEQCIY